MDSPAGHGNVSELGPKVIWTLARRGQREDPGFCRAPDRRILKLSRERRGRYQESGSVCQETIKAAQDNNQIEGDDPRLRKLDELMWTYLRLLVMEGSLAGFIARKARRGFPREVA